jgi:hypothetical protein
MKKNVLRFSIGVLLFVICLTSGEFSSLANRPEKEKVDIARVAELTVKIASLTGRIKTDQTAGEAFRAEVGQLAKERFEALKILAQENPAEVLRFALPGDVLEKIPAEGREYFEKREEVKGELEVVAECGEKDGKLLYYVNTGDQRLAVYFVAEPSEELATGRRVVLNGIQIEKVLVVSEPAWNDLSKDLAPTATALTGTTGEQRVLALLVNFQDNPTQPVSPDEINNTIFNTANSASVTNYYRENSYGQTWVAGAAYGWFTLNMNSGCDYKTIASKAKQAAQNAGINLAAYDRYMYIYPAVSCGYSGLGTVGGNETWIVGAFDRANISHELGHNLGLQHSRYLDCGSVTVGTNCTVMEYGHILDTMGSGRGHFHSYQKEKIGWLNYDGASQVATVSQNGNYFINPYQAATGPGVKALKILKSIDANGGKTWYYIELRRAYGFESGVGINSNIMNGVMINLNQESNSKENYMLDMTPETTTRTDPALTVNRTYTDTGSGISITPLSVGDSGAVINVSFNGAPEPVCVLASPAVSVSPAVTQWVGAGGSVSYSVTVTNNNSSSCTANSFNLQTVLPAGWSIAAPSPTLVVAPGATVATNLQVVSPVSENNGFFTAVIGAANSTSETYSATVNRELAVYSSLGVGVTPSQTAYTMGQTAVISAYVSANGSPMPGANVTFKMIRPNGKNVTAYAVTGANGVAVYSYRFNKKQDPLGTYSVNSTASLNNVSGSGSASFQLR